MAHHTGGKGAAVSALVEAKAARVDIDERVHDGVGRVIKEHQIAEREKSTGSPKDAMEDTLEPNTYCDVNYVIRITTTAEREWKTIIPKPTARAPLI